MGLETGLTVEETVAVGALQVRRTVAFVRLCMILAPFLHAGSTKVGLVVGAGVMTSIVVGGQTMRAEITFAEKTFETGHSVIMFVFMK